MGVELERMSAAARELDELLGSRRMVELSHRMEDAIPSYPTHPKFFRMRWPSLGDPAEMNQLVMGDHSGTHVDATSHFVEEGPARKHIDEIPLERFRGRALTMRFGPFEGVDEYVRRADLEAWERENVPVEEGDIVFIDFQWAGRWRPEPEGLAYLEGWPGLHRDAAEHLRERGVKAVGTDCISLDPGDGGGGELASHYTFLPSGILIFENLANLGEMPPVGYAMALPLPIAEGTGSPVRVVAFVR